MNQFSRYAIYYAPPKIDPLAEFTASWLGWDANLGQNVSFPKLQSLRHDISLITNKPRKYGFHGTLKPPFSLKMGRTEEELFVAVGDLAQSIRKFEIERIKLKILNGFIALIPERYLASLHDMASKCVIELDCFRANESPKKLEKRRLRGLSKKQEANLTKWGYPFVLDEFKFHLTLSDQLTQDVAKNVMSVLAAELEDIISLPLQVKELCLFGENYETGNFQILHRFPLMN